MSPVRDKNGRRLPIGSRAWYCGDLFEVAGHEGGHVVAKPIDPEIGMSLRILPSALQRAPSRWQKLLRWLRT